MRTVVSICLAAVAGACLALFLLGVFVAEGASIAIPVVSLLLALAMFAGALSMARRAGTPGCLPLLVFVLFTLVFFGLLWSSWE